MNFNGLLLTLIRYDYDFLDYFIEEKSDEKIFYFVKGSNKDLI
jgi:hypothetical protein